MQQTCKRLLFPVVGNADGYHETYQDPDNDGYQCSRNRVEEVGKLKNLPGPITEKKMSIKGFFRICFQKRKKFTYSKEI